MTSPSSNLAVVTRTSNVVELIATFATRPVKKWLPGGEHALLGNPSIQLREVFVVVEVQRHLSAFPAGQINGVRQSYAVDAFAAGRDQWFALQDVRRKVLQDRCVLRARCGLELQNLRGVVRIGVFLTLDQSPDGRHIDAFAELALRLPQPSHRGRPAFVDHDLAAVAEDLEPIGAHHVVRCGDKDSGAAAAVVDQRGDLVLDRYVAAETVGHLGVYRLGDAADPLPEVELVRSLVDQNPTTFAAPGASPCALVVVDLGTPPGRDDPTGVPNLTDLTRTHDFFDFPVERVVALVEHDGECELRLAGRD